jgi:hypothetical protein
MRTVIKKAGWAHFAGRPILHRTLVSVRKAIKSQDTIPWSPVSKYSKARVTLFHSEKTLKGCSHTKALTIVQHLCRSSNIFTMKHAQNLNPNSVTLLGNNDNVCHRFGSLGLNLACEGLLMGMWAEGPSRFPLRRLTTC